MRIDDIFEGNVPVATVWRKRGDTIERGRISKFVPNPAALKKIKVVRDGQETEKDKSA